MLLSALLRRGCLIKYRNKPIDLIAFNLYMRVFVAIDQGIHHTHTRAYIFFSPGGRSKNVRIMQSK